MKIKTTLSALAAFVLLISNANAQSWLTNGLVAYHPFNGSTFEATYSGYNFSNLGATLCSDRFGNPNSAYYFNGSGYMITATNTSLPSGSSDKTLSLWLKTDSSITNSSANYVVADFGNTTNGTMANTTFGLFLGGGSWYIHFNGPNQQIASNVKPDTQWHHFVIIYASGYAKMFIDGIQYANAPWTTSTAVGSLVIGNNIYTPAAQYFHGIIDDVRVYNRAFSSNEVVQLYALESAAPATGITIYSNSPVIVFPTAGGVNYQKAAIGINHTLQMATNLASPVWVTVSNAIPFSGFQVTNPPSNAFFRLN